jgi:hypothetical protein
MSEDDDDFECNEAQIAMIAGLLSGRLCPECGDPREHGHDCQAEKRALLKHIDPKRYGDA